MPPERPLPTMLGAAIRRAQHQLLDRPLVFHDPVVLDLVPEAREPDILAELGASSEQVATLLRAMFAMRSRFAEDRLAEAVARGVGQYVIIGAGLDTFAWRQPPFARSLRIFAVDHPAGLEYSRKRFREADLAKPSNLFDVAVDLRGQSLGKRLAAFGFNATMKTFCSLLGVTQYIERGTVDDLLGFARSLEPGSEMVLSIVPPDDEIDGVDLEIVARSSKRAAGVGEPWITRIRSSDVDDQLRRLGFSEHVRLTPEDAQLCYFQERSDNLRAPKWEHLLAAIV